MNIKLLNLFLMAFLLSPATNGRAREGIRVNYLFYYKPDSTVTEKPFRLVPDMTLDLDGEKAAFYSEAAFQWDSLSVIGYDRDGNIADNEAVGKLFDLSGKAFKDYSCFQDYRTGEVRIRYNHFQINLEGYARLSAPDWELLDREQEVEGYPCKQAHTRYMGRDWFVWYTEDIPVNAGPWLLRGLPGLILYAVDRDKHFYFRFTRLENGIESRHDTWLRMISEDKKKNAKRPGHFYAEYPLDQADRMATRVQVSTRYADQLMGRTILSAPGYTIRADGSRHSVSLDKPFYVPLIPEDYWKTGQR